MQKFMQIKEYLLELSFLALLIRIICVGAGIGEALAVVSLVVSMAYNKWLTKTKLDQYQELKDALIENKKELQASINDFKEESEQKFSNLFAKLNYQNLETTLAKKGPDLQKLLNNVEKLEEAVNGQAKQVTKRRLF